ncbi:MAG TPA: hypothetical protein VG692_13440 [Gemmatimonadales bacterium]|nr:hypothetical protein [Gemmatimonadales bacterium]
MPRVSASRALVLSLFLGAGLWLATTTLTGRREAWDAPSYWTVTYPLCLVAAAAVGYLSPERAWRWGLAVMLAQAVTMAVLSREFGLLPLGLLMFGVLAVPPMLVARFAASRR